MSRNASLSTNTTPIKSRKISSFMEIAVNNVLNSERKRVFTIDSNLKIPTLKEHYSPEHKIERMDSLSRFPKHRQPSPKFDGDPKLRQITVLTKEDDIGFDVNFQLMSTLRRPIEVSKAPFIPTTTNPFSFQ